MKIDIDLEKMVKDSLARNLDHDEKEIAKFNEIFDIILLGLKPILKNKIPDLTCDNANDYLDSLTKETIRMCYITLVKKKKNKLCTSKSKQAIASAMLTVISLIFWIY